VKFLADESCSTPVIRALRAAGHDVLAIAEIAKGTSDEEVLKHAVEEQRVLVTEDNDFGELAFARGQSFVGVIFVKFHSRVRRAKAGAVVEAVKHFDQALQGGYATVEPGRVRLAKRPHG
jgi:predicted nuclease of predicted toxin-antitoxin system